MDSYLAPPEVEPPGSRFGGSTTTNENIRCNIMSGCFGMVRGGRVYLSYLLVAKIVGTTRPYNNINYTPPILKDMV